MLLDTVKVGRRRALAERIGVDWADFALVSPDIFRKYLLDYESLGEHYKYAGVLTGEELQIVHRKLDRYMEEKAERGEMTHLLIDRFRFDSFAPESTEKGSNLLTRFGHLVCLFFMVTPPHLTVERDWERGLRLGRFKTVDDLLHHNVEAYAETPELFFTWAQHAGKTVHYEFLGNDVPMGEPPRTIAFGSNREMAVFDVEGMLDIEHYRKISVDARAPEAVYPPDEEMAPERNLGFLRACIERLDRVDICDPVSGAVLLRAESGAPTWADAAAIETSLPVLSGILGVSVPQADAGAPRPTPINRPIAETLGRW